MANLFPIEELTLTNELPETTESEVNFGRSWRFDFGTGDFVMTPTGKVAETDEIDAWVEWCKKALHTGRYRYLVYNRNYGHEFEELIGRGLTKAANESEIKRMATECLMVDPRTAAVENFNFELQEDQCFFTCMISNVQGETSIINGSVVNT